MFQVIFYSGLLFIFGFNLCLCFEDDWEAFQSSLSNSNREELVITNVTTDEIFKLDFDIKRWISLSIGPACYSVGLMETGITILFTVLNANGTKFEINSSVKELNRQPIDAVLLQHRNLEMMEVILVVAFRDDLKLEWYKIHQTELVPFSTWNLVLPVVHINAFSFSGKRILLLASDFKQSSSWVDLRQYRIKNDRIVKWPLQSLDVSSPVTSSAFNVFESDCYLSLLQNSSNVVAIFKAEKSDFVPYKTIRSKNVASVVSFEIGFKTFLAIDGQNAGIYQFKKHGLEKENIDNSNLDKIEHWLPVPVRTYRHDLVLFAQRNLNYSTHSGYVIDIFTYNGGTFEEHEDVPCTHFGEQVEWLTCLNEGRGIIGSNYIAVGDTLGLIVPNKISNTSLVFMIYFAIEQMPNPLEMELEMLIGEKEKLQAMIEQQNEEFEQIKKASGSFTITDGQPDEILRASQKPDENLTAVNEQLDEIAREIEKVTESIDKIVKKENRTEFDVITINGTIEMAGGGKFKEVVVHEINGENTTTLLEDIVRKDSAAKISGEKIMSNLIARNVNFDKVNGIEASKIVFPNDSPTKLTGNINVHGVSKVENVNVLDGKINDMDLIDEIVNMRNEYDGTLNFTKVKVLNDFQVEKINDKPMSANGSDSSNSGQNDAVNDVVVLQNLTVTNINGEDFDIFIKQLCLINIKCYIPGDVKINGDIIANKVTISYLNGVKFPEEYFFNDLEPTLAIITGRKTFTNTLVTRNIQSRGKVDGVDTKKLILLSTNQPNISGKITFRDIEVVEELNVIGKILGEHIDKFLPNPTLQVTRDIKSNVSFKKLEVDGSIIIENNLNEENFEAILKDVVYKDEEEATISAQKEFPKGFVVRENMDITTNSINKINLDSIVTKHTDQILSITLLRGNVIIKNLEIGGKFNGENITQLDQDFVKLHGEQHISSTLIFKEELQVENLEVNETLNKISLEAFIYANDTIDTELKFKDIEAEHITVEGDFIGAVAEMNFKNFSERYLSYSKDQVIEKHYDIFDSAIDNLVAERVNSEDYDDFFNAETFSENIKMMLNSGHLKIGDLLVVGPLQIDSINRKNESDWLPKGISVDKKELTIEGDIFFDTLDIEKISNVNWEWYSKQPIFKNEVNTTINASFKNFVNGIRVNKLIETKELNGVPIENILTKQGKQKIRGPVTIKGDIIFKENVNILENLNEVAVRDILDNLMIGNGTYHVKGDMRFKRMPHIYNLDVRGHVNNKDITEHLSHVIHLDEDYKFLEKVIFEKPVRISGNLAVEQSINGINFSEVANQIVLITKDAEIEGPIVFSKLVVITDHLAIERDLKTKTLYGINLEDWKNNAVRVDRGKIAGSFDFDEVVIKGMLTTKYLNDVDMDFIIPLKSDQSIDYLKFGDVTVAKGIPVLGSVNGYKDLSDEYEKTVLADKDQQINANIIFHNVILVREDISTNFINGKEVSKIVTTNTDQNLTSVFNFKAQCTMESDLYVHGLINGINITSWEKRNLKKSSPKVQEVYNDWSVRNLTFGDDVEGIGLINDMNLTSIMEEVEDRKKYKYKYEKNIIEDYKNMCTDVSYIYEALKKQIYKFKYFEKLHTITFSNQIQFVYYFEFENNHYLLVNENNCSSQLLVFKSTVFEHLSTVQMGHVSQVVLVRGNEETFLVTTDAKQIQNCEVEGTNVWHFDGKTLELYYSIDEQDLLQESVVPFTFYGLSKEGVTEFKINYNIPRRYRKWKAFEENMAFMPRGLKTGLSLRTGHKIVFLRSTGSGTPPVDDFNYNTESVIIGNVSQILNNFVPGQNGGDLVVMNVGITSARRTLLAVATLEETSVRGRLDSIKIYSDIFKGELFHKVPAYKPSSLLSVEFDQGETLLVFMENERTLQVYEYKGIEGFILRSSAKVDGSKLILMTLPIEPHMNPRKTIGIIHEDKISLIQSVMVGNKIRDDLKCGL